MEGAPTIFIKIMHNKKILIFPILVIISFILGVLLTKTFWENNKTASTVLNTNSVANLSTMIAKQSVDIFVPRADDNKKIDGVHYEGEAPEVFTWGPKAFELNNDGTFWIYDSVAQRGLRVNRAGDIFEVSHESRFTQPILDNTLNSTPSWGSVVPLTEGYSVDSTRYFGTSINGWQYWYVEEAKNTEDGKTAFEANLRLYDANGKLLAYAILPFNERYTSVPNGGIVVDPLKDEAYVMVTKNDGVEIKSVSWKLATE